MSSVRARQKGFTLVELVAVIIILGVLATATTQYIIFGTQLYVESNERQQVLSQSRFLIERMTREIRGAIPHSIRVDGTGRCMEFVPVKASGAYRITDTTNPVPISPNASAGQIEVISWDVNLYESGDRMYIYATDSGEIYQNTNALFDNFAVLETITKVDSDSADPRYTMTLARVSGDEDVFADASPIERYFTADHSVNYCLFANNGRFDVYRFESTTFSGTQSVPNNPTGVLMAEGLTNNLGIVGQAPFEFVDSALTRNSVVNLYLQFEANLGENMFYNHEVHIPNAP